MSVYSLCCDVGLFMSGCFFFQAEDGIRDLVRSRGLGDVYKRQVAPSPVLVTVTSTVKVPARQFSTMAVVAVGAVQAGPSLTQK